MKELTKLLFNNINQTIGDYESLYPPRQLSPDAMVTRFAPSPTGFLHIGGLFTCLINERLAHQSDGVFYLRIEDTDKKREKEEYLQVIIDALRPYGIVYDEGCYTKDEQIGRYGPYLQSQRKEIYQTFAKEFFEKGNAYPCFCQEEELKELRISQLSQNIDPGYKGIWAKCRNLSVKDILNNIGKGIPYVIRLKSPELEKKIIVKDLIKGVLEFPQNNEDFILLKSDGMPTYHFAHLVDDYLMHTTHVIRDDGWVSSLPKHIQLFDLLEKKKPFYGHLAPIQKLDEGKRRKLSKRKDPEAAVTYYNELGIPKDAIIEYLLNLANSSFEDWRKKNVASSNTSFQLSISKLNRSGALLDLKKLDNIGKDVISVSTTSKVLEDLIHWSEEFDNQFYQVLIKDLDYLRKIIDLDKGKRKDYLNYSQFKEQRRFYFDEYFYTMSYSSDQLFVSSISVQVFEIISTSYSNEDNCQEWWSKLQAIAEQLGFARTDKDYHSKDTDYKGDMTTFSTILRLALTKHRDSPDLYSVMNLLGQEKVKNRMKDAISFIKSELGLECFYE
jgi:glutamyl-tRNA synthetase